MKNKKKTNTYKDCLPSTKNYWYTIDTMIIIQIEMFKNKKKKWKYKIKRKILGFVFMTQDGLQNDAFSYLVESTLTLAKMKKKMQVCDFDLRSQS